MGLPLMDISHDWAMFKRLTEENMKFKRSPIDDDGLVLIEINIPFTIGPITAAQFLKLMHLKSYPFKEPSQWKIRDLLWHLKNEVRYHGRTRIDATVVETEEESLYFGAMEKYFPELKR
jgi:hypothetical protein